MWTNRAPGTISDADSVPKFSSGNRVIISMDICSKQRFAGSILIEAFVQDASWWLRSVVGLLDPMSLIDFMPFLLDGGDIGGP